MTDPMDIICAQEGTLRNLNYDFEIQQKQINWLLKELAMVSEALGLDEDDCQIQSKVIAIKELEQENAELKRIIAESQKQEPIGTLMDLDLRLFNKLVYNSAPNNLPRDTKIFASPVIQEGMQLVPIEPTEKMIQAACLSQSLKKYDTYEDWWNDTSSGVSERIRNYIINDYRSMLNASKEK